MKGNRKRPDPGKKVFNKSAATAPTAVLKVRKTPAKIERTAYRVLDF